ncbi:MAG: TonB-dependent receptor [Opitutae bacterium]|nr:TonB-dependent receptor [Opitutae bacterium]
MSAQTPATGAITGRVSNKTTGEYLVGAVVSIEGTQMSTTTERGGEFRIAAPAGAQTLVVSYASLDTARIPVSVSSGVTTSQDVAMNAEIYTLEVFTVTGLREGTAKAMQNQRQSMNAKSVAAIDTFGNPGAGVGELLQRLPGITVDMGSGGDVGGIYVRGMNQNTFGNVMVDGSLMPVTDGQTIGGQYVYLGQVSTTNIESLEVIKATLPDMDGNSISGVINLRTKRAFDRTPGRYVTLTAGTKWTNLNQDKSVPGKDLAKLDHLGIEYSEVFSILGGKNNLGVSAQINRDHAGTYVYEAGPSLASGATNVSFVVPYPAPGAELQPLVRGWSAGNWNNSAKLNFVETYGFNVDWKATPDTVVYFKATYSDTSIDKGATPSYFRWRVYAGQSVSNFTTDSTYDLVKSTPTSGTVELDSVLYKREGKSATLTSGIEQKFFNGSAKLTVDGSYNRNRTTYPAINEAKIRISGIGFQIDRRGQDFWYPKVTQIAGPDWSNPANYSIVPTEGTNGTRIIDFHVPSTRGHIKADFRKDFAWRYPVWVQVGAKHGFERTTSDRRYYYYNRSATAPTSVLPYLGYNNVRMAEGHYGPFSFLEVPTTGKPGDFWNNPSDWTETPAQRYISLINSLGSFADVKRLIDGAYIEGQVKINRLRVLGGLRVEQTNSSGASPRRVIITAAGASQNTSISGMTMEQAEARARANYPAGMVKLTSKKNDVFPGLHLVYDITPNLQARASYNVSITRPSLNELARYQVNESATTGGVGMVTKGNPDLLPYTSDNFELAIEGYFGQANFSAGVFRKQIHNYFRSFDGTIGSGPDNGFDGQYAGYTLRQNLNVGGARIQGVELSYQQSLRFLPGFLKGFSVNANVTSLQTEGDFGSLTTVKRLPNLTPLSYNAGIAYKGYGFDIRLMANYRGKYYISTTNGGAGSPVPNATTVPVPGVHAVAGTQIYDLYQEARMIYDLKTQYTINRIYSVYCDVYNLTNQYSLERTLEAFGRHIPYQAQHNGVTYAVGIKARF